MPEKLPKGLYRRGDILWARFKVKGVEYRETLRTRSVAVAERRMKVLRQEIEDRAYYGAGEAVGWPGAVVAWDSWIKRQGKRPGTIKRYLVSLAQLRPWLDTKDVHEIDAALVKTIVRDRARMGITNATIRRDLTAMASVLDCAMDEGWIEENAAHSYDRRRLQERRDPIALPDGESIAAVLALGSRFVDMVALARETGMREEEIASLTHSQVDRDRMSISLVHTKGRRAREIPLTPRAVEIIDRQPQFLRSPFVFWRGQGERFNNVSAQFYATVARVAQKRARAKLPFRRFRFHDLRHLFAVESLRSGRHSIYELQQVLGHASVKTTEGYLDHLTPEENRRRFRGWHKIRHGFSGLWSERMAEMADLCGSSPRAEKPVGDLANRWFQPLTHVSEGAFPRDCAVPGQAAKREKREEQRFLVAQRAAQSVHALIAKTTPVPKADLTHGFARLSRRNIASFHSQTSNTYGWAAE